MGKNYWSERKPNFNKQYEENYYKPMYMPDPHFQDKKNNDCCCSDDMYDLLKILVCDELRSGISGANFAFIGKNLLLGTTLELYTNWATLFNDNISAPSANFDGFDNCTCGYINVSSSALAYSTATSPDDADDQQITLPIAQVSLCNLDAIVFDYNEDATNFIDNLKKVLDCDRHDCSIPECKDCCCNDAILNKIGFITNYINLVAGWLALYQARYLGRFGNVAVFQNTSANRPNRIYFICLDSISYFGTGTIS